MGDILRIYSGGAQVNLYDSTNGVLHLGYASEDILIESEPQVVPLSDGNRVEVQEMISFEATLLETDSTKIDNIIARKGYLQEVYIIGLDSAYKFRDCFIRIKEITGRLTLSKLTQQVSGKMKMEGPAAGGKAEAMSIPVKSKSFLTVEMTERKKQK